MTNLKLKKLLTFMLALCMSAACLTACGDSDESSSKNTNTPSDSKTVSEADDDKSNSDEQSSATPDDDSSEEPFVIKTELSDNLYDYQVSIDGEVLYLDLTLDYLYQSGWVLDDSLEFSAGYGRDGQTMIKDGHEISCGFNYDTDEDIKIEVDEYDHELFSKIKVHELVTGLGEFTTANGIIQEISTKDDLIAAYGEPAHTETLRSDLTMYYYYENAEEYGDYHETPSYIAFRTCKDGSVEIIDCIRIYKNLN